MRGWLRDNSRAAVLVGLTLAVPLLLTLYWSGKLLMLRQGYQQQVDRLEPRISRLMGLVAAEDELKAARRQTLTVLDGLAYSGEESSDGLSTSLQKNVRNILASTGLSVTNSQVLPVKREAAFDRISLKVTVSGTIDSLDMAFAQLAEHRPLLLLESVEIWPKRRSRRNADGVEEEQELTASLQLLSLGSVQ